MYSKQDDFLAQVNYQQMCAMVQINVQNTARTEKLFEQLSDFENITTLEEARELAKNLFSITDVETEKNIKIANADVTIINQPDMLRISIDTEREFKSYDFA